MGMSIEQPAQPVTWLTLRTIGSKGWNVFDNPQDIDEAQVSDVLNVVFDEGNPTPRGGSAILWNVPAGELNAGLCAFPARASDGTNYPIIVYAPNFYLRDEVNDQWVKLNSTYTPSVTYQTLMYGYSNWNAGISKDVLYFGNGKEDTMKWQIAVGYVSVAASMGATSLTLSDATKFPTGGGTVVIQELNQPAIYVAYSAADPATGILTVSALSGAVGIGACVASQVADASAVAKGKIFETYGGRLFVANQAGGESTISASQYNVAENFVTGNNPGDPFVQVITDGNSGISGLNNFGQYLLIEKDNSLSRLTISTSSSGAANVLSQEIDITPVVSNISSGPVQPWARLKKDNLLYFATETEGIYVINPDVTGYQTSILLDILSKPIKNFTEGLDFSNTRMTSFDQKILITGTSTVTSDVVLVYDILRSDLELTKANRNPSEGDFVWTKFSGWNVKDWLQHDKKLLFISRIDNCVYETFTDTKMDGNRPYEAYFETKIFDFGLGSVPKTIPRIYVEALIKPAQTLFFDVKMNIGGTLSTTTYAVKGTDGVVTQILPTAMGMLFGGGPTMGGYDYSNQQGNGVLHGYLATPFKYGFFGISVKVYGTMQGSDWAFYAMGFPPYVEHRGPAELDIKSIVDDGTA